MAYATSDLYIRPEDGWVLVATNPTALIIKPDAFHPWWVAITAGTAPADALIGLPMGRGGDNKREPFQTGAITGNVYIRVRNPVASEPASQHARFGIILDSGV
jgi:hypothetical protein